MASYILPNTTYKATSRQAGLKLNTIMEDSSKAQEVVSASTISSYYQQSRSSRDFDDLYDATDSESDVSEAQIPATVKPTTTLKRASFENKKRACPTLLIPQRIQISTEALAKLAADFPSATSSAAPSLAHSSAASAASSPSIAQVSVAGWNDVEVARSVSDFAEDNDDTPLELPAGALDILHTLSFDASDATPVVEAEMREMQEVPHFHAVDDAFETASQTSELSQLSIPSPGGFFSSLENDASKTWSQVIPTSAVALNFYNAPWNVETEDEAEKPASDGELRLSMLSRTSEWLASQDSEIVQIQKAVKFLESDAAKVAIEADKVEKADPYFYEAFQNLSAGSSPTDSFVHRNTRFDAVQAIRCSLQSTHVDSLMGNYSTVDTSRPAPQRPISMMKQEEESEEQRIFARAERERQALEQLAPAFWVNEAQRFLAGGKLINGPAAKTLEKATSGSNTRVLDLGGQAQCDWAWHVAAEFPSVKTYTATCDTRPINNNIRGPSNHRVTKVPNLYTLPFPSNHFDVISARNLFQYLKVGNSVDEYDLVLAECMRCLKPGGYLEFFLMDSEIVHAGPTGIAASVEFQFNLKARGYDCAPTKTWLSRVRRSGFDNIKRAWTFLPLGSSVNALPALPETPPPNVSIYGEEQLAMAEAVQGPVGSGSDAAHVSGLVASWTWEQWLLKLQMEMGKTTGLVEGVGAVVEEGRHTGSGMRSISGWARKPF